MQEYVRIKTRGWESHLPSGDLRTFHGSWSTRSAIEYSTNTFFTRTADENTSVEFGSFLTTFAEHNASCLSFCGWRKAKPQVSSWMSNKKNEKHSQKLVVRWASICVIIVVWTMLWSLRTTVCMDPAIDNIMPRLQNLYWSHSCPHSLKVLKTFRDSCPWQRNGIGRVEIG